MGYLVLAVDLMIGVAFGIALDRHYLRPNLTVSCSTPDFIMPHMPEEI